MQNSIKLSAAVGLRELSWLQRKCSDDYIKPWLSTKFRERAFSFAGTSAWNSLPNELRCVTNSFFQSCFQLAVFSVNCFVFDIYTARWPVLTVYLRTTNMRWWWCWKQYCRRFHGPVSNGRWFACSAVEALRCVVLQRLASVH